MIVCYTVDLSAVSIKYKIGSGTVYGPHTDGAVQRCGGKRAGILRVQSDAHHVMIVALENADTCPVLLPVPHANRVVVTAGEDVRFGWVDLNTTNIVVMCLLLLPR